jgi:hypothetical protein
MTQVAAEARKSLLRLAAGRRQWSAILAENRHLRSILIVFHHYGGALRG